MKFVLISIIFLYASSLVLAQDNPYPNELENYKFFGVGKLKDLQLTGSSKSDVKNVFGEKCEKTCDYDSDWLISFEYYEDIWIKESRNERDEKLIYVLDSKYLGKLSSVEMRPKKYISFSNF